MECGSAVNGGLAVGCEHCTEGSKLVLFVTGRCSTGCAYCPVSLEKKGKEVTYANESRTFSDEDVIAEAKAMDATGTGLTGGDPMQNFDLTLHYLKLLKNRFGPEHHVHLYTSTVDYEKTKILKEEGLDEIRFHPREEEWMDFDTSELEKILKIEGLDVGLEVPALPGREKDLNSLISKVFDAGVSFMNLNELEFSESNWNMMEKEGYLLKDDISSAIKGSEELALGLIDNHPEKRIHYCSSSFKDGVQLRRRLIRRGENTAAEYEIVTEDGTILKGLVYSEDVREASDFLKEEFGVPEVLILEDKERGRVETAPWVLREIADELPYDCYIVEEYPTADRLEVERMPLGRLMK